MHDGWPSSSAVRFILFIATDSSNSIVALANLESALARLDRPADLVAIVNVYERPDLAQEWNVLVTPTLVSRHNPKFRVIGDLSSGERLEALLT